MCCGINATSADAASCIAECHLSKYHRRGAAVNVVLAASARHRPAFISPFHAHERTWRSKHRRRRGAVWPSSSIKQPRRRALITRAKPRLIARPASPATTVGLAKNVASAINEIIAGAGARCIASRGSIYQRKVCLGISTRQHAEMAKSLEEIEMAKAKKAIISLAGDEG